MNPDADPIALILEQQDSPFGSSRLFNFFDLLIAKTLDETRDDSARLVACLQIPSRRSLLQHDEYMKGEVSTQHGQAALRKVRAVLTGDAVFIQMVRRSKVQATVQNVRGPDVESVGYSSTFEVSRQS